MLDGSEVRKLELPFFEEEVRSALKDLNGEKAPGPDGFSLTFWKHNYDIIKDDPLKFFQEFRARERFVRSLNYTFLVLIPIYKGAEDLKF